MSAAPPVGQRRSVPLDDRFAAVRPVAFFDAPGASLDPDPHWNKPAPRRQATTTVAASVSPRLS